MSIPKVFVSYSHDSPEHKNWVLEFATKLRSFGIDAVLDQWDLRPGDDLAHFMETQLTAADRVLMICTEKYVEKANAGLGGVGYEKMIVTAATLSRIDSNKVIPIVRQIGTTAVPTFLKTKLYLNFSSPDQFEFSFDELVRTLHNAPLFQKPPVTKSEFAAPVVKPALTVDPLRELMSKAVAQFEAGSGTYLSYKELVRAAGTSRIMLDLLFADAEEKGLLRINVGNTEYFVLTEKGKRYAVENKLVK